MSPLLQLPDDAGETIVTAALTSERLSPILLAAASGRTVTQVTDHIAQGLRAGLLQHGPTGLAFVHALVRDAIIAHTDPGVRARLEAGIAAALQATGDDLLIGASALHWDRAAGPAAARNCRDAARQAAAAASAAHAHDEAVAFARMSVGHARRLGADGEDLAARLVELAAFEWLANLVPDAVATCAEAVDLAETADRPDLMAEAALIPQGIGSAEVARTLAGLCRRALDRAPEDDTTARARLTSMLAITAAEEAVDTTADTLSEAGLDLARRAGSPQAELEAVAARHYALSYPQAIEERIPLAERALTLGRASTTAIGPLWGHLWQADIALQRGDLAALDSVIAQLGRLGDQRSSPLVRWHEHRLRALVTAVQGVFDEARSHAEAGLLIAERTGDRSMVGMYHATRIQLAYLRGDPSEIPTAALPMLDHAPPIPLVQASLAHTLAMLGEGSRAAAVIAMLRDLPERMPLGPRWAGTIGQIGLTAAALDDTDLARRCYSLLAPTAHWYAADGGGTPFFHGSNEYPVGLLARAGGRVDAARNHFERAIAANLRIGARPFVALARLALAECLEGEPGRPARSSTTSGRALASEAADEFRRLDMPGPLARAERLLARLRPEPLHCLTARELKVAQLVAHACTNQQIAQRLFLSVRTVESHVRSALAKLQLTSRTELALWIQTNLGNSRSSHAGP